MNSSGNHPDFELTFTITIGKERLRKKMKRGGRGGRYSQAIFRPHAGGSVLELNCHNVPSVLCLPFFCFVKVIPWQCVSFSSLNKAFFSEKLTEQSYVKRFWTGSKAFFVEVMTMIHRRAFSWALLCILRECWSHECDCHYVIMA